MLKNVLLISTLILFAQNQAFASGCDCGSVSAIVKRGTLEVNLNTAKEAQSIRSEILLAAQNIIGTLKVQTATLARALQDIKETLSAQMKGASVASEAMHIVDTYGEASQPQALCGSSTIGAGVQISAQAGQQVKQSMREKQITYSNTPHKPVEYLNRVAAEDHPDVAEMANALFPVGLTLKEDDVAKAQETVKSLGNPRPVPMLTAAQQQTPAGQTYTAARTIHEARLAMALEALNAHVIQHAPTLPGEVTSWAQQQWSEAGAKGNPPGVIEGKMSEAALYNLLSQMRIGNPNWYARVAAANETGLLREMVMMQAVQLELTRKNNESLDRLSLLAAIDYLTSMEGTTGKELEDMYTRTIGAQQ